MSIVAVATVCTEQTIVIKRAFVRDIIKERLTSSERTLKMSLKCKHITKCGSYSKALVWQYTHQYCETAKLSPRRIGGASSTSMSRHSKKYLQYRPACRHRLILKSLFSAQYSLIQASYASLVVFVARYSNSDEPVQTDLSSRRQPMI